MMEPDERIKSNELGYCQRHTQMMYDYGNKLSHALVLETRIKYIIDNMYKYKSHKKSTKYLFSSLRTNDKFSLVETCAVCDRLKNIKEDFISNIFYMYKKDETFKRKFSLCKGFCIVHFELLLNSVQKYMSKADAAEFIDILCKIQKDNLQRVLEDVVWFTKKFDYRYRDEDWKNSKDAVLRGSQKISGYIEE